MTTTISVQPIQLDLRLYAGDGFTMEFKFVDKTTGTPWPTTGAWAAQARSPAESETILLEFDVDNDAGAGTVTMSLLGEQTRALLGARSASWDLQQHIVGAEPRTWYRGKISATQDVTRP